MRATSSGGIAIVCPGCTKRGKVLRAGKITCPVCKTRFQVDGAGLVTIPQQRPAQTAARPVSSRPRFELTTVTRAPVAVPSTGLDLLPEPEPERASHAVCARHPDEEARETCSRCGDFVCSSCRGWKRGVTLCPGCAEPASVKEPVVRLGVISILGRTFETAWRVGWRGIVLASLPSIVIALSVLAMFWFATHRPGISVIEGFFVWVLSTFLLIWLPFRVRAGLFALARAALQERRIGLWDAFSFGSGRCFLMFLTALLAWVIVVMISQGPVGVCVLSGVSPSVMSAVAIVATVLTGLVVFLWSVSVEAMLHEEVYGTTALGRSAALVSLYPATTFAVFLLASILKAAFILAVVFAVMALRASPLLLLVIPLLGPVFAVLVTSLHATLYFALVNASMGRS